MSKPPLKRPPTSGTRRGNGAGWGGAAKGGGAAGEAVPFEAGNQAAVGHGGHDLSKAERIAKLTRRLEFLSENADSHMAQIAATKEALNRLAGMPIARNVNMNADEFDSFSDNDIESELARLRSARAEAAARDAAPGSPPRLTGVVH